MIIFLFSFSWNPVYQREKINEQFNNWTSIDMNIEKEIELNKYLLAELLKTKPIEMHSSEFNNWNEILKTEFIKTFSPKIPNISCKKSIFGKLIQSMGIQGYYNPISGEAQINADIPPFLQPFVMAHEMAHQLGIAAEADANFIAYYICSKSSDASLKYSALLNLYLYNIRNIGKINPEYANTSESNLPIWIADHLTVLREFNKRKPLPINELTMPLYEYFLKINGESKGLKSYGGITKYGYIYELLERKKTQKIILRPFN